MWPVRPCASCLMLLHWQLKQAFIWTSCACWHKQTPLEIRVLRAWKRLECNRATGDEWRRVVRAVQHRPLGPSLDFSWSSFLLHVLTKIKLSVKTHRRSRLFLIALGGPLQGSFRGFYNGYSEFFIIQMSHQNFPHSPVSYTVGLVQPVRHLHGSCCILLSKSLLAPCWCKRPSWRREREESGVMADYSLRGESRVSRRSCPSSALVGSSNALKPLYFSKFRSGLSSSRSLEDGLEPRGMMAVCINVCSDEADGRTGSAHVSALLQARTRSLSRPNQSDHRLPSQMFHHFLLHWFSPGREQILT